MWKFGLLQIKNYKAYREICLPEFSFLCVYFVKAEFRVTSKSDVNLVYCDRYLPEWNILHK
jgi:hypothetical protein